MVLPFILSQTYSRFRESGNNRADVRVWFSSPIKDRKDFTSFWIQHRMFFIQIMRGLLVIKTGLDFPYSSFIISVKRLLAGWGRVMLHLLCTERPWTVVVRLLGYDTGGQELYIHSSVRDQWMTLCQFLSLSQASQVLL